MDLELIVLLAVLAVGIFCLILLARNSTGKIRNDMRRSQEQLREEIRSVGAAMQEESHRIRQDNERSFQANRSEIVQGMTDLNGVVTQTLQALGSYQRQEMRNLADQTERLERGLGEELRVNRGEQSATFERLQEVLARSVSRFSAQQSESLEDLALQQRRELQDLRNAMEGQLTRLTERNAAKLEEMRQIVDEKLQNTLEKRFSESFRLISERLEQVHKGLGEMQTLASGVGDLRRILGNVKTRGTLGEIQLGTILEQMLSPEQFVRNAHPVPGSAEVVEYAVRLPGPEEEEHVLLPLDSKFPLAHYERLRAALEEGADGARVEGLRRAFEQSVRKNARDIQAKYIRPPHTTDFALMFVPTEGLYAEILRTPGLFDSLQREQHVTVVGPSNLTAFLSSLQMGFRTLAIQKRSGEVWNLLGSVKSEFGRFGDVLEKTKAQLERTVATIEDAGRRSRLIEKRLRSVEALPGGEEHED